MAMVPWFAVERFGAELTSRERTTPVTAVRSVEGRSVRLPVRAKEVSEGFVMYAVQARTVQAILAERRAPFVPVDLGRGRTVIGLFGARYLVSDLGTYDEVGCAFFVAPRREPWAVGLYYFELTANTRFSCEAAKAIWGVVKNEESVTVAPADSQVSWRLARRITGNHVLTVSFPRGGGGASTAIPLSIYTMLGGRPQRARSIRTGRGERLRLGRGQVRLTLGDHDANARDPLWQTLRRLGLPEAPAMLHGWTEHMWGELGAPHPLSGLDVRPVARS
jgi:hypothetical protein